MLLYISDRVLFLPSTVPLFVTPVLVFLLLLVLLLLCSAAPAASWTRAFLSLARHHQRQKASKPQITDRRELTPPQHSEIAVAPPPPNLKPRSLDHHASDVFAVCSSSREQEFYEQANASNYLSRVRVPLMVVNAKDDPFIDGDALPEQERVESAPVRLVYQTYGGHCG